MRKREPQQGPLRPKEKAPEIGDQHVGESNETPYTDADIRRDLLGGVEADVEGDRATTGRALSDD
jgi:hypothetical protein